MGITIGFKPFAAGRADEVIHGSAVYGFWMSLPPCQTTAIRAEAFLFRLRLMFERFITVLAGVI